MARKPVAKRMLKNIRPFELALVPKGANKEKEWVVLKEETSMLPDIQVLTEMKHAFDKAILIMKAGTPDASVVEGLKADFSKVQAVLNGILGESKTAGVPATKQAMDKLSSMKTLAETMKNTNYDLNTADQIDSLLSEIAALESSFVAQGTANEVASTEPSAKPVAGSTEVAASAATTAEAAKPAATESGSVTAATPAAETVTTTEPAKASATDAATATEVVTEAAQTETVSAPEIDVVTKADLDSFKSTMNDIMKSLLADAMKGISDQMATVLKSAVSRPTLMRPAGITDMNSAESGSPVSTKPKSFGGINEWDMNKELE